MSFLRLIRISNLLIIVFLIGEHIGHKRGFAHGVSTSYKQHLENERCFK